jgi:hypothetical protein
LSTHNKNPGQNHQPQTVRLAGIHKEATMKYGFEYREELYERNKKGFFRWIVIFCFLAAIIVLISVAGCTVHINIASEGQPVNMILADSESLKME